MQGFESMKVLFELTNTVLACESQAMSFTCDLAGVMGVT